MKNKNDTKKERKSVANDEPLQVGDRVTWCHAGASGKSIIFSTRNGKITNINGSTAVVQMRNGRSQLLPIKRLRRAGETTELTEMLIKNMEPLTNR